MVSLDPRGLSESHRPLGSMGPSSALMIPLDPIPKLQGSQAKMQEKEEQLFTIKYRESRTEQTTPREQNFPTR